MTYSEKIREVLITEVKFLAFRPVKPDLMHLGNYYLALGIVTAWLAGVGRYWDNPRAELWQYLGLGSLAYIFVLAMILWALIKPLQPENWSYKSVLIFVGMTSPPAILYAIPVERYFTLETSQILNVWFLAIVAIWRVILLFKYLIRSTNLSGFAVFVAAVLPLVIIVSSLAMLNLEHVVFRIMAGLTENEKSANDAAYGILMLITYLSFLASPVLLVSYIAIIIKRRKSVLLRNAN
ncbi:MAG: hypothetical protein KZQ98_12210 [Candidatus Thiodiazotropha sp. (ex Lucinoma borealis)]|nr:hypothetical protein [Candidatus Thiodiazotropha sp. (ex Lucinoma borealis)]